MAAEGKQVTYKDAGVDTQEGARAVDAIKAAVHDTYRPEVIGDIGGFGGLFSLAAAKDMKEPVLVSGTDGVGTKLEIAKLMNNHATVGIDLVAMCANDILVTGAEPLFFLDYFAIGKLEAAFAAEVVGGIAEGCKQAGCALIGGEMAEHPGVMDPTEYDLSGFCVGIVDKDKMLDPAAVKPGDVILGLPSSGVHSNGFSLVRKVLLDGGDASVLHEPLNGGPQTVGEALLAPTRIYVKPVRAVLEQQEGIHAMAHITGGGITENLNRALPETCDAQVNQGAWDVPEVISYVIERAGLSTAEAYKTFNMGIGLALIVDADKVDDIAEALEAQGERVVYVGEITEGTGKVSYK